MPSPAPPPRGPSPSSGRDRDDPDRPDGRTGAAGPTAGHQLSLDALGTPLIDTTFLVLDLETTGLDPARDRITEVGAVKVRGGEVLGELRSFVHPGRPIPAAVTAMTGITDAMVAGAPTTATVLGHVIDLLTGSVLVAHNASFDLSFLRAAAARDGRELPSTPVVDTARLSRRLLGDEVRDHRLATLARHLRARTSPEHRALADARATVDVLHGLLERAGSLGATTLEDLVELTRSRSDRAYRRRSLVAGAPSACGVYRFLDARGQTLYVGKATDLRSRLRTYFGQDPRRRIADLVRETAAVTWRTTPTLLAAEVEELRAIQSEQPRYNRRSRTPRSPRWLALTREPFPRLSVVAAVGPHHLDTIGPFDGVRTATAVRDAIEEAFPVRTCRTRLRAAQDHPSCILKELGRCGAPCDGTQDRAGYAAVIAQVVALRTDPTPLLNALAARMEDEAAGGRFERAGALRDLLHRTAHALTAARDHGWLTAGGTVVVVRGEGADRELVHIHDGRLVDTERGQAADRLDGAPELACPPVLADEVADGSPSSWEEQELLRAWLAQPGVRLLRADQGLHGTWEGGALLAVTRQRARETRRRLRQDHQVLSGAKVTRRSPAPDAVPDRSADGRAVG